ncbi:hypothetical protein BDK92_1197 [Micromonospora pisi]|uniref:Uncharacterized protein n=1 Tax=Micromonospora pisi TaxID=589240 RepID=A0A495JDD5_9ACTN|nr:hypothetical protein [Micromonospora pisi]RKR86925.1 hypothetical protein BDK92_1197 [Micromonospora pisi]
MEQPANPVGTALGDLRRLLVGLTAPAAQYLIGNRNLAGVHAVGLGIGSTLPVALAPRRALWA